MSICRLVLCLIALCVGARAQNAPEAPGAASFSDIAAHSISVSAPALPAGALFLTLQKRAAWDYYAPFADVAANLAGGAVTGVANLDANTYYAFRYLAVNAEGETAGSESQMQTLPDAPIAPNAPLFVNVQATSLEVPLTIFPADTSQLKLQQKPLENGIWSEAAQFDSWYSGYNQRAYVYYLQPETAYRFRWVAVGPGGTSEGAASDIVTTPAPPNAPESPTFSNITAQGANVTLPALPIGATSLRLEKRIGDDWYNPVYESIAANLPGGATVTLSDLTAASSYQFRVVAIGPGGETAGYDAYFQTLPPAPDAPAAPTFENVQATSLEVPLPNFPANTDQLKLEQKLADGGAWSEVGQFDSWYSNYGQRAYVYNLQAETAYLFRWVAVGPGGTTEGAANDIVTAPAPPQAPDSPSFSNITAHSASVTLPALPVGATSLRLEKRIGDDYYNPVYETVAANLPGGATVTLSGLNAASSYQFRVIAIGLGGETAGSDGYLYTAYEAPDMPSAPDFANVQATQLDVPVPAVANAGSLRLQRKNAGAPDSDYSDVVQVNLDYYAPPSVTVYYLTPATAYVFRWIAVGNGGETAGPGAAVTTLTGGDPSATPTPTPTADPTPTPTPTVVPTPTPQPRPVDVTIATGEAAADNLSFAGESVYNQTGANQTKTQSLLPQNTAVYTMQVQNEGDVPAAFLVTAPASGVGWTAHYYFVPDFDPEVDPENALYEDITTEVIGEGWTTPELASGARCTLELTVELTTATPDDALCALLIQAAPSDGLPDAVKAATSVEPTAPSAPQNLTATAGVGYVGLSWNAVSGATGYNLYRSTTDGGPYSLISPNLSGTAFTDSQVTAGTTYFYVVRAINTAGGSPDSNQAQATPTSPPPPHPVDVTISNGGEGDELSFAGSDVFNETGANQNKSQSVMPTSPTIFTVQVQNKTAAPTAFTVTGPGDELGWAVHYYAISEGEVVPEGDPPPDPVDVEGVPLGQDVTSDITGEGWVTPVLEPGRHCTLQVNVDVTGVLPDGAAKAVLVRAAPADGPADVVKATTTSQQFIEKVQVSQDQGITWIDIDANGNVATPNLPFTGLPFEVEEGIVFDLRAIRKHPELPWPAKASVSTIHPEWDGAGIDLCGEKIAIMFETASATPLVVNAKCGNVVSVKVKVQPEP